MCRMVMLMTDEKKVERMTPEDEIAELRRWLRADIQGLHAKLDEREARIMAKMDKVIEKNDEDHGKIFAKIGSIDKKAEISATKIGILVAVISVLMTTGVSAAIHRLFT